MTAFKPINALQLAKLRVSDFLLLNDAGVFEGYAKSELIEGEIWVMNAIFSTHAKVQFEIAFQLRLALQEVAIEAVLYTAGSVELSDDSLPEPDVIVATDHSGDPLPLAKVMLVVEVSDITLANDLGRKAKLYASSGVSEYWVADIEGRRIVRMWQPEPEGYANCDEMAFGGRLASATLVGVTVDLTGL